MPGNLNHLVDLVLGNTFDSKILPLIVVSLVTKVTGVDSSNLSTPFIHNFSFSSTSYFIYPISLVFQSEHSYYQEFLLIFLIPFTPERSSYIFFLIIVIELHIHVLIQTQKHTFKKSIGTRNFLQSVRTEQLSIPKFNSQFVPSRH